MVKLLTEGARPCSLPHMPLLQNASPHLLHFWQTLLVPALLKSRTLPSVRNLKHTLSPCDSLSLSLPMTVVSMLVGIKQRLCLYILRHTGHNTFWPYSLPHVSLWVIEEEMEQNENGYSLAVTKIHIEELQVARLWKQGPQYIYSSHVPPWQVILQTVEVFGSRALQTVNISKWHYQQVPFMIVNFSSQIQWKHCGCLWKNGM